jgi:hypothetical protein
MSTQEEERTTVEIEMLYQQRMTVRIPAYRVPPSPESVFHLVRNTDPEFVADVLPSGWDDAVCIGDLDVIDIRESTEAGGDA